MADTTNNSTANVTAGKPKVAGAIYIGTANMTGLPTTASAELPTGMNCVGYISEDGLVNANSPEVENIKAWGGDTVLTPSTSKEDTFQFTMLEVLNQYAAKLVYGGTNVTSSDGAITITANNNVQDSVSMVVDMIMRGNRAKRIVVPNAMVTEVGDITYADGEAVGYETTLTAMPDASGNTHYEYIAAASTT